MRRGRVSLNRCGMLLPVEKLLVGAHVVLGVFHASRVTVLLHLADVAPLELEDIVEVRGEGGDCGAHGKAQRGNTQAES